MTTIGDAHSSQPRCDRQHWAAVGDRLLLAVRAVASPEHARITPPGREGGYGRDIDGLEGFARTFLLAGFRLAGEAGADPHHLAEWYARGIAAGVDGSSPERWVRLEEHPQAKVEAASIALVLELTRAWIWDRLSTTVQQRVVDYLAPAVGDTTYPRINWVWFRLVVQTFLRSVGGPWSRADMEEDLATHDGFVRAGGWLTDGDERAFDHYTGWALHTYPTLWAGMRGAADLAAGRRDRDVALLDRFLLDAVRLIGGDGSPLIQGRSLTYRFAAAAPLWAGAIAAVPSIAPGALRHAACTILDHFERHGAIDARGLLTVGWHGAWPRLAQAYSGPASPYWASKGLLGLALPADHPVWTAAEEPLPIETGDTLAAVVAPGWLLAGTRRDGIVRVVNHGTDHAVLGALVGDSPLYARLGYSTATSPLLDGPSWIDPLDQSVVLRDARGRATHRAGMQVLALAVQGDGVDAVGLAASVATAHWLTPDPTQADHGSGFSGIGEPAGRLTVVSLVRGPWEVRLAQVLPLPGHEISPGLTLRVGGWPVAGPGIDRSTGLGAEASSATVDGLVSRVARLPVVRGPAREAAVAGNTDGPSPEAGSGVEVRTDASPLGPVAAVPWLTFPVRPGAWVATLVELAAAPSPPAMSPAVQLDSRPDGVLATVTWPDGRHTPVTVPVDANPQQPPGPATVPDGDPRPAGP